jgi:NADH:ubiquinone reductase (H+-translocating)
MAPSRVVIVGAGFGGLAAKALGKTPAQVILIDRTNHHLFQPLLYQVATSVLTPSQIATPIRGIFRKQKNTIVILGEVTASTKIRKTPRICDEERYNDECTCVAVRSRSNSVHVGSARNHLSANRTYEDLLCFRSL